MKKILSLFWSFFKIGLFTFGGGYAMISLVENEFVEKRKLVTADEFMDMIAVAESTPGPIAINMATNLGYRQGGFLGSLFATIGVILPSFVIMFVISLFLRNLLEYEVVVKAFKGISSAVAVIILFAGIKLAKNFKKNWLFISLFIVAFAVMVLAEIKIINFSYITITLILFGGIMGLIFLLPKKQEETQQEMKNKGEDKQ